ncbi:MAG: ExsB family transcriptional regulator [Betaproteobacteria bacterium RIFCSPLOWO2_12_FULL_67_28]|nr:MAG: ExsB family transcriptional regulator [Betaproteobacteria bacterium RIFCSPLOWO2_12_FULL_67_28]
MSLVNLVSGGLDSTLVGVLAKEEDIAAFPLFIDYGQRAATNEWGACRVVHKKLGLAAPTRMDLSGFGQVIRSGLTCDEKDLKDEAFTPGRNLMFLVMGAAYAHQVGADAVATGLLSERFSLFPDQRAEFVASAERAIVQALGRPFRVLTPLFEFSKADVVKLAAEKGISGTYSCHAGTELPCGRCVSCLEFIGATSV